MRKNKWLLATGMILVLGLSACQKSPDSSIVVNKDLDNLIDEAQNGENGSMNVTDVAQNYDSYQTMLQDESLGVTVNVDARVDIPKTSQMSVFRVAQAPITQELLTRVQQELVQGETLYEGSVLNMRTKSEIEADIQWERDYYNSLAQRCEGSDLQVMQEETQRTIDRYQEEYETAPAELVWEDYPSDGLIHSVEELYQADTKDDYYSWQYSLNPNGEVYYGVSDGKNGRHTSLFVQNNPERGNCIRYRSGKHGYEFISTMDPTNLENVNGGGDCQNIWDAGQALPVSIQQQWGMVDDSEFIELQDETVTISKEKAVEMAEAFLNQMGLTDFQYYNGGLYYEILDLRYQPDISGIGYRKEYVLTYMRNIDGAFVTFEAAGKHEEGWNGDDYVKKDWGIECIEFRINDDGIIGFDYYSPLTVMETVVEQSNMKTFEEIRSTFETMVIVANAIAPELQDSVNIEIDRVILGYARISEADSYDTGLIVPVWDFKGKTTDAYGETDEMNAYGSVMTINAIDGSVIDRTVGY